MIGLPKGNDPAVMGYQKRWIHEAKHAFFYVSKSSHAGSYM